MFEKMYDPELRDGLSDLKENYMRKELLGRSRFDWVQPGRDQDGIGNICVTDSVSREMEIADIGRTDELQCLPHFSSCCLPGFPGTPSFCCTESEDSHDFRLQ